MKKSVSFKHGSFLMAGDLYLPDNFDENKKYAAVVTVHPGGGVKEQVSGLYSQKLSDLGYVALAFDASHQGESGGEPRYIEEPASRVEDVSCAVDFLTTLPYVDQEKIGIVGVCAGGGYTINASMREKRIKAVVTVSGVDIGSLFREAVGGPENILGFLGSIGQQRTAEANGAEPLYAGYVPNSPQEFNEATPVYAKEAYEYYRTPRGAHPNSTNQVRFTSFASILGFSAFTQVETLLNQPTLLIAGTHADTKHHSEEIFDKKQDKKELFWIEGASHVDLYDKPQYVDQAVRKINEFFAQNL